MTVTILYTAQVCTCCAIWCANNDRSGCDDSRTSERDHPHDLMADITDGNAMMGLPDHEHFAGCGVRDDAIGYCDSGCEETDFSRARCDGCGTDLAGTRMAVTVLSS